MKKSRIELSSDAKDEKEQTRVMAEISEMIRTEHLEYRKQARDKYNHLHEKNKMRPGPVKMVAKRAMKLIDHNGKNVIDFGCGNGELSKYLKGHDMYVGIDIANELIAKIMKGKRTEKEYFLAESITNVMMPAKTHIGYCIDVLECVPDDFLQKVLLNISLNVDICIFAVDVVHREYQENVHGWNWWKKEIEVYFDEIHTTEIDNHLVLIAKSKS